MILGPVLTSSSSSIYPAGNYEAANPGEQNPKFIKKKQDEVHCHLDFDGFPGFKELIDPTDPKGRDVHWHEFTEFGHRYYRFAAATILDMKQISNSYKTDAIDMCGGEEKVKVAGSAERKRAIDYLCNKGLMFAPLKPQKAQKNKVPGRFSAEAVTGGMDPEVEAEKAAHRKAKNIPADRIEDSERIYASRGMFLKDEDKTDPESVARVECTRQDGTKTSILNPIHYQCIKEGYKPRDLTMQRATIGSDGKMVLIRVPDEERPFWTCRFTETANGKVQVVPIDDATIQRYRNTLIVPKLSCEWYIASVQGKALGPRQVLSGIILVDRVPNNIRPDFGAKPLLVVSAEDMKSEKFQKAEAAMRRDIARRKAAEEAELLEMKRMKEEEEETNAGGGGGDTQQQQQSGSAEKEKEKEKDAVVVVVVRPTTTESKKEPDLTDDAKATAAAKKLNPLVDSVLTIHPPAKSQPSAAKRSKKNPPSKKAAAEEETEGDDSERKDKPSLSDADMNISSQS